MRTTLSQEVSTRSSILEYLKKHGDADARGMAEFRGLTSVAVGRHLLRLKADGLIETKSQRPSRGRPAALYSLTGHGDAQFPRDYAGIANDLLLCVAELDGPQKVRKLFRKRRGVLEQRFGPRTGGKPFERRVRALAEVLTECGYMAYITPRLFRASSFHCSAESRNHLTASVSSCRTSQPLAYLTPRLYWAAA